ncbi:ABC transporter ATP-binding protein [Planctomicrobium piriforme]|uniref:ABC-2 type transport system ATP-binding protein n=1 Tax=Planctomicrobium piriforme TaxID=1576369 RepID=A0A1I3F169_9PLAN|nr:ATP-binding cassette domain-containing protein [Planctomicrobium piriforme]SFI04903.1 ABC-2 type transport system ATP-binding protein [Planctomicrobium piriforme]
MPAIVAENLCRTYRVYQKREGLMASVTGLFHRTYKTVNAVRNVSFEIDEGEMVAFLGPNGAGKTTTLKLLSGLIYPSSGSAHVLGYVPWRRENAFRRRFSLVMGQKNQLWWDLPAQESFQLHREIYRIPPADFDRRKNELIDLLEVRKLIAQPVRELSLGERMRMELIAALLHSPEVLLLDEPTIGLDVVSQRRVQEFLKYYQAQQKITVILTSHYMKDVEALCKRAIIINDGQIKHDGPLAEIVERFSQHKVINLQFAVTETPTGLERFGNVLELNPPRAKIEVERTKVPEVLGALLSQYRIEDVGVQDRPLEEVIAEMFAATEDDSKSDGDPIDAEATAQRL